MRRISLALLFSVLLPATGARADDGAIESVGGSVAPMKEHPTIHLKSEFVHAWIRPDGVDVECVFFLENRGPATTVTMGFPNRSHGADVTDIVPFRSFASYVDGDSVATAIQRDAKHRDYGDFTCWYTKAVRFDAGQTRCVRNVYSAQVGSSVPDYYWFEYILWSGATWAGPIDVADVVFTFEGPGGIPDSLGATPAGFKISPRELRWHLVDFEPTESSQFEVIRVGWSQGPQ